MITARTLLFLAGGEGGAEASAGEFVKAAGGGRGKVAPRIPVEQTAAESSAAAHAER